jgi:hypothetical protein
MTWSFCPSQMDDLPAIFACGAVGLMVAHVDACYSGAVGGRAVFSSDDLTRGASTAPVPAKASPR